LQLPHGGIDARREVHQTSQPMIGHQPERHVNPITALSSTVATTRRPPPATLSLRCCDDAGGTCS
jgi:hypothetical protein